MARCYNCCSQLCERRSLIPSSKNAAQPPSPTNVSGTKFVWYDGFGPLGEIIKNEDELTTMGVIKLPLSVIGRIKSYLHRLPPLFDPNQVGSCKEVLKSYFETDFFRQKNTNIEHKLENLQPIIRFPALDNVLLKDYRKQQNTTHFCEMRHGRIRMPIYTKKDDILFVVNNSQISIIKGVNGCGKSTQIPQFILDEHIQNNKGSMCKIVSVQPQRLSAISLAERVACERGEPVGQSVGYILGLENNIPDRVRGSILFCTQDLLLQEMETKEVFQLCSHLILDEFHDRTIMQDFILAIFKQVLWSSPLKVIIITDSRNGDKFAEYFGACSTIYIPRMPYSVREYFLEDALLLTGYIFPDNPQGCSRSLASRAQFYDTLMPHVNSLEAQNQYNNTVRMQLLKQISEDSTMELAVELILHICKMGRDEGAILVILSCREEVELMYKRMTESGQFPTSHFQIKTLHSQLSINQQREIFYSPASMLRQVILSTDIAVNCITIEDVAVVIDCGKKIVNTFEAGVKDGALQATWISKAEAGQRCDRAGRVKPGSCYHLYSHYRDRLLEPFANPDMQCKRLDLVILMVKLLKLGPVDDFLATCINPPYATRVGESINFLRELSALDEQGNLTALGYHLARLRLPPQLGKMMMFGVLFSCVNPILDIASTLYYKSAFFTPMSLEDESKKRRIELSDGFQSDHILFHLAMHGFQNMVDNRQFCEEYFISYGTMAQLVIVKQELFDMLCVRNYLNPVDIMSDALNVNSQNFSLIKSILCASFYPNVIIGKTTVSRNQNYTNFNSLDNKMLQIHPNSSLTYYEHYESPFFVQCHKVPMTSSEFFEATMIFPIQLVFFAPKITFDSYRGDFYVKINDTLKFKTDRECLKLILELRDRLNYYLVWKSYDTSMVDWDTQIEVGVLKAVIALLINDTYSYEKNPTR